MSEKTLSEAIEKLEKVTSNKTSDLKSLLQTDFEKIKSHLEELSPYLDQLKKSVETEALESKNKIEQKIKKDPWLTFGIVALIAFFVGWLLGQRRDQ